MLNTVKHGVNTRGWRKLPPDELGDLIMRIRRSALQQHLSAGEWRALDRMRRRHAAFLKDAVL
jgi:hypothetical protein